MSVTNKILLAICFLCILYPIARELCNWARFFWREGTIRMLTLKNKFVKDPDKWLDNELKSLEILKKMLLELKAENSK